MPDPLSEPLFGGAHALVDELNRAAASLSLEELRIVETNLRETIRHRQLQVATRMRSEGATWNEVGRGLGMSAQGAQQRFSALT